MIILLLIVKLCVNLIPSLGHHTEPSTHLIINTSICLIILWNVIGNQRVYYSGELVCQWGQQESAFLLLTDRSSSFLLLLANTLNLGLLFFLNLLSKNLCWNCSPLDSFEEENVLLSQSFSLKSFHMVDSLPPPAESEPCCQEELLWCRTTLTSTNTSTHRVWEPIFHTGIIIHNPEKLIELDFILTTLNWTKLGCRLWIFTIIQLLQHFCIELEDI